MAEINLGNDSTLDVSVATDKKIETSVSDVNYIPGYKVAEEERKSNELVRQENEEDRIALYEDMQNKLESGYFNGKDGAIQYTAGTGIEITENNVINNTQTSAEWGNITGTLSDQNDLQNALNDKADSSDIPLNVSELVNDSNFIDNTVNNLTNYYLKTETYTKTEIDTLIAQIPGFNVVVVQTLPVSDIDTHTIYLVPKTGSTGDIYDEYLYINNTWELIGNTAVDLSNYYTKPETNTLLNTKQDTLVSGTSIKTINNESLLGSGNVNTNEIFVGDILPSGEDADSIKLWLTDDDALDGEGNYISNEYGTSQEIGYSQEYLNWKLAGSNTSNGYITIPSDARELHIMTRENDQMYTKNIMVSDLVDGDYFYDGFYVSSTNYGVCAWKYSSSNGIQCLLLQRQGSSKLGDSTTKIYYK